MKRKRRCEAVTLKGARCKRACGRVSKMLCLQHFRISCRRFIKRLSRKLYVYSSERKEK